MRMSIPRPCPQRLAAALALLLVCLGGVRAVRADGDDAAAAERRYAREQILRRARESVDPSNPAVGGLEGLRDWLAERAEKFAGDTETAPLLKSAQKLLGEDKTRQGLIRQAAALYRWVAGDTSHAPDELPPDLYLVTTDTPPTRVAPWPAEALKKAADEKRAADEKKAGEANAPDAAKKEGKEGKEAPESKPVFAYLDPKLQAQILEYRLDVERRSDGTIEMRVVERGEGGEAVGSVPAGYETLRGYVRAAEQRTKMKEGAGPLSETDVLFTRPEELTLGICKTLVDAREKQVAPRVRAFQADNPAKGLVSEGTVRDKLKRAQRYRDRGAELEAALAATRGALDRMVVSERRLTDEAGRLGFLIEEARRNLETLQTRVKRAEAKKDEPKDGETKKDEPKDGETKKDEPKNGETKKDEPKNGETKNDEPEDAGPPPTEKELADAQWTLDKLELREIVGAQYLRLLYIAVRRADARLGLYADAIRQAQAEEVEARAAAQRYEVELNRMRRERQLDRLLFEEARLRRDHEQARAQADKAPEQDRPLWTAYVDTLEAQVRVNQNTRKAVELRRKLEQRAKPPRAGDTEGGVAPPSDDDPIARWRTPRAALIDAKDARDASDALGRKGWTGELVAAHYEVVRDRIDALREALRVLEGLDALRKAQEKAVADARAGLDALQAAVRVRTGTLSARAEFRYRARETRKDLDTDVGAFEETLRGIADVEGRVHKDIQDFESYRRKLLDQGPLSFQIRVRRTLDADRLAEALDDVGETAGATGRWITLQGEENAGTFLQRHWLMLLLGLAALVASVLLVRFGRAGLDRLLRAMASRVPALRTEPVTVRAEEAQKKREKAMQEAARQAAEAEALRQVSSEKAARPQKMGEGGYGGEDD